MLQDKEAFKAENLTNWDNNTDYWLNNPLRQVEDTKKFFVQKLSGILSHNMSVIDMGCGNGWVLDLIQEVDNSVNYIGLDFNEKFILHLAKKYEKISNAKFELVDLEESLPDTLINCADVVFNCFNFFETANLDTAFENGVKMLKHKGKLVIFTIEYSFLMLALSHSIDEYKSYLSIYEKVKSQGKVPYFFQNIDLGNSESKSLKYASVLYSFDDYFKQSKKYNMILVDYGEVVKTSKFLPKTYQYFVFEKL